MKIPGKIVLLITALVLLASVPAYAEEAETALYAPGINVFLSDAETGSCNVKTGAATKIHARVLYEGCCAGEEYSLVLKLEDTASGAICPFGDGTGTWKQTFVAEAQAGILEFEFDLNTLLYSGRILAEIHYIEGYEAAYPTSSDKNSGHIYVPGISTDALSEAGEKTVAAGKNTVICDVVTYNGLAPNEEYRLVTGLKDASTGEFIRGEDGTPISVTSKFTPKDSSGQIASKITANLREYGDRYITVFESLYIVPKTGIPFLLLSNEDSAADYRTLYAGLTEITVLDRLYNTSVSGVRLRVISSADGFTFEGVSDENGSFCLPLSQGETAVCTVVTVPEGYESVEGTLEFSPSGGEEGSGFNVYILKKNIIVFTRTDAETGLPVQGIITEVKDSEGKTLATVFSDESGLARFDANACREEAAAAASEAGEESFILTLHFTDTSTPSEYFPRDEEWTVSLDEKGNITGITELKSVRRRMVTLSVVDGKGTGITGVQLSIIGPDGTIHGRAVTDPDGKIYFTPKTTGEYMIIEDDVPAGYMQSFKNNRFTVEEDGEITGTVTVKILSESFASGAISVAVLTALFVAALSGAGFFIKKSIRKKTEKLIGDITRTGKHSG